MKKFIEREPKKKKYPRIIFSNLDELEKYIESSKRNTGEIMYNADLSQLDLSGPKGKKLLAKINGFDEKTTWPESLSKIKKEQLETSKDSGLGISELHKKGYTGKGINIAIIDQYLLLDHPEYQENIKYYKEMESEEIYSKHLYSEYHAPAVSSLAVGKTCGSAPNAGLYFVSTGNSCYNNNNLEAIKHLIELNKNLSDKEKIRCLSCSWGGGPNEEDFEKRMALFKELEETGCIVIGGYYSHHIGRYHVGGTKIQQDSDHLDTLEIDKIADRHIPEGKEDIVMVPEHKRTFASHSGGYLYEEIGGSSWTCPYLAGLVACALQANPDFVKQKGWQDKIWEKLLETAKATPNHKGKIVQPEAFVMSLIEGKEKSMNKMLQKAQEDGKNMIQNDKRTIAKKGVLLPKQVQH